MAAYGDVLAAGIDARRLPTGRVVSTAVVGDLAILLSAVRGSAILAGSPLLLTGRVVNMAAVGDLAYLVSVR